MRLQPNNIGCSPRGALVVLGGILIHLSLGTYYTFGNFSPYIVSYLRNRTDDVNIRNVDGIWITSIGTVANCLGMTGGGLLDKRFGTRIAIGVGSAIFSSSVALTYFSVQKSFVLVVLTYGVIAILGNHMAYGPPVQTSIKWFPNHPSLATGLIVAGFGGGALIFNQVITNYINPDNLPPDLTTDDGDKYFTDPDLLDRVPTCFLILAGSYAAMQILGIIMVTRPPVNRLSVNVDVPENDSDVEKQSSDVEKKDSDVEKKDSDVEKKDTYAEEKDSDVKEKSSDAEKKLTSLENHIKDSACKEKQEVNEVQIQREYTTKEAIIKMFKTRSFYLLWFGMLFGDTGLQFVFNLYKAYGQTFISDDRFLALVGSLSSVCNCLGRPLWGIFMDRFGYKISMGCITTGVTILVATLFTTEYTGKAGFLIWICVLYLTFSGILSILPTTMAKLFGISNMAVSYGFLQAALSFGGIISGVFAVTLKSAIGFRGLFFLGGGLNAITIVLIFFFNGKEQNGKPI